MAKEVPNMIKERMGTTSSKKIKPASLQDHLDLYNDGKMTVEELTEKAIPLLVQRRQQWIFHFMMKLISDRPAHYHISSPHHASLWGDAVVAYDAKIAADLAANPSIRIQVEETIRRVNENSHLREESIE